MRLRILAAAGVLALSGCGAHGSDLGLQQAALAGDFTVADVVGPGVERAFVFCPYTDKGEAERLGFDAGDVPGIDDNYRVWETASGIGVIAAGRAKIEWFDPRRVDGCGPGGGAVRGDRPGGERARRHGNPRVRRRHIRRGYRPALRMTSS